MPGPGMGKELAWVAQRRATRRHSPVLSCPFHDEHALLATTPCMAWWEKSPLKMDDGRPITAASALARAALWAGPRQPAAVVARSRAFLPREVAHGGLSWS